jgi:hypothetical protein
MLIVRELDYVNHMLLELFHLYINTMRYIKKLDSSFRGILFNLDTNR